MSKVKFNPDLRLVWFLPRNMVTPRTLGLMRRLTCLIRKKLPSNGAIETINENVSVRIFRPKTLETPVPALLWLHGGGYVMGHAGLSDGFCSRITDELGIITISVEYRLAPEHPFPAGLEDAYSALIWLSKLQEVDSRQIAIGGESGGGGLAASLALLARNRGEITPIFQLLAYPMIDNQTGTRTDVDPHSLRLVSVDAARHAWRLYLKNVSDNKIPPLAVPARYKDLSNLPPAWIGVGTNDLFHDENVVYAQRLREAGIPCTLYVAPGAYHAFDLNEPNAGVSKAFFRSQIEALRNVLNKTYTP